MHALLLMACFDIIVGLETLLCGASQLTLRHLEAHQRPTPWYLCSAGVVNAWQP